MQLAELETRWWKPGSPLRIERAEIKQKLSKNGIARRHIEFLLERIKESEIRAFELAKSGQPWSDQMLACLTHLLESEGRHDLVKKARILVGKGWPNHKPKPDHTS